MTWKAIAYYDAFNRMLYKVYQYYFRKSCIEIYIWRSHIFHHKVILCIGNRSDIMNTNWWNHVNRSQFTIHTQQQDKLQMHGACNGYYVIIPSMFWFSSSVFCFVFVSFYNFFKLYLCVRYAFTNKKRPLKIINYSIVDVVVEHKYLSMVENSRQSNT